MKKVNLIARISVQVSGISMPIHSKHEIRLFCCLLGLEPP